MSQFPFHCPANHLSSTYGKAAFGLKNIYHRSSMQIEKSQPEGKRLMPEMRFTEFPALSVVPRVGISWSASEADV